MDKVDYGKKPLQMDDYGADRRHYHVDASENACNGEEQAESLDETHHCGEDINEEGGNDETNEEL